MLNDKKYKVPTQTSPENQILFMINGLEQKIKKLEKINSKLLEACKEALTWQENRKDCKIETFFELIQLLKQAIAKAEDK